MRFYTKTPADYRRFRTFAVNPEHLLSILNALVVGPDKIRLPKLKNLPDGCVVNSVFHEPCTNAFTIVVSHPSFPVVSETSFPDRSRDLAEWVMVEIPTIPAH